MLIYAAISGRRVAFWPHLDRTCAANQEIAGIRVRTGSETKN